MKNQETIFIQGEGDRWFDRNKASQRDEDIVVDIIQKIKIQPKKILEIGCSYGNRLEQLHDMFSADCYGIDPSIKAIEYAKNNNQNVSFKCGVADDLPYENNSFDLLIFGFCLYVCSRNKLFKIAYEADRILKDRGCVVILDFHPNFEYKNKYVHCNDVFVYKMDYSKIFTWNPSYTMRYQQKFAHNNTTLDLLCIDEICSVSVIEKVESSWNVGPFKHD